MRATRTRMSVTRAARGIRAMSIPRVLVIRAVRVQRAGAGREAASGSPARPVPCASGVRNRRVPTRVGTETWCVRGLLPAHWPSPGPSREAPAAVGRAGRSHRPPRAASAFDSPLDRGFPHARRASVGRGAPDRGSAVMRMPVRRQVLRILRIPTAWSHPQSRMLDEARSERRAKRSAAWARGALLFHLCGLCGRASVRSLRRPVAWGC